MSRKSVVIVLLIISIAISLVAILDHKYSIAAKLPGGVAIMRQYRGSGFGNGDSVFAFKAAATKWQYSEFCRNLGVSLVSDRDKNEIGYLPIAGDLPEEEMDWWNEPQSPESKSFLKEKRGFRRVSFSNGFIYYFSRTW